ncbi:unnamed protein product, partial [Ectocarpus sp. 12 AP-2014]
RFLRKLFFLLFVWRNCTTPPPLLCCRRANARVGISKGPTVFFSTAPTRHAQVIFSSVLKPGACRVLPPKSQPPNPARLIGPQPAENPSLLQLVLNLSPQGRPTTPPP